MVDTVIHIMKMGNRNHCTVGNWNRQTSFQQGKMLRENVEKGEKT